MKLKSIFDKSRLFVIFGVVRGTLLATIALFIKATVDLLIQIQVIAINISKITDCYPLIEAVDHYLLASVLLGFAYGLYKLFKSNGLEKNDSVLLYTRSLDDLKERLGKVILMTLIVKLYGNVTHHNTELLSNPTLMGAIFIVALALYLTHNGQTHVQTQISHENQEIDYKKNR